MQKIGNEQRPSFGEILDWKKCFLAGDCFIIAFFPGRTDGHLEGIFRNPQKS